VSYRVEYVAKIAPIKEFLDVARDGLSERFERDAFLIGFRSLHSRSWVEGALVEHTIAELLEFSVLGRDDVPVYDGARIISAIDLGPRRRARAPEDQGRVLVRPGSGQVLGVR
jgi:hypothetical protein